MPTEPFNRFSNTAEPSGSAQRAKEGDRSEDGHHSEAEGPAAVRRLQRQLEELTELVRFYFSARTDAFRASMWRAALSLVAVLLVVLVAATILITCSALAVLGIAHLIAGTLGDRLWAGYLITGFGLLLVVGVGLGITMNRMRRASRARTLQKYEKLHAEQKARFGHDVSQLAAAERRHERT